VNRPRRSGEWSVVLFVVALLAFNPPILSIFSVPELLFGIPVLYLYIFAVWGVVIALLAVNVSGRIVSEEGQPLQIPMPMHEPESVIARDGDVEPPPASSKDDEARHDRKGG